MAEHNELGKWGEDEAELYLKEQGYMVVERDWKIGKRDLDIVAYTPDGKELAVVEVKTRATDDYLRPEQAVDRRKMRNLAIAANAYVKKMRVDKVVRFDIISIVGSCHQVKNLEHIVDAFNPLLIL